LKKKEKKKEFEFNNLKNATISGASSEVVQRYGSAVKEHYMSYTGINNETGKHLKKGLKDIANSKINPDYEYNNLHQQAGFSAEIKIRARENANNIINDIKETTVRTDDIGMVNDEYCDLVTLDSSGNIIKDSERQVKFIGNSQSDPSGIYKPKRILKSLKSRKFEKYLDKGVKLEIPSDDYDDVIKEINDEININQKSIRSGKLDSKLIQSKEENIKKLELIKKNLKKSNISSKDALEARMNPLLSTGKEIVSVSHEAGVQGLKFGAAIGGSISIIKNMVAFAKSDITFDEAMENFICETGSSAAVGYSTTFSGSAIKGIMQNSTSQYVRTLSKTNLPGTLVAVTITVGKSLTKYFRNEIDGLECMQEIGQEGANMVASAIFATIGQIAIPIPVVGGLIGGMLGYSLSAASFGFLKEALENEKIARENRLKIEEACNNYIQLMDEYKSYISENINNYLYKEQEIFCKSFEGILDAAKIGDIDWFIDSANNISLQFGKQPVIKDKMDFLQKMESDETIII
jgi:hypothetical protein